MKLIVPTLDLNSITNLDGHVINQRLDFGGGKGGKSIFSLLHQIQLSGTGDSLGPATNIKLLINVVDMGLDYS